MKTSSLITYSFRRGETWLRHVTLTEAVTAARATGLPLTRGWAQIPVPDGEIAMPEMLIHSPISVGDDGVVFACRHDFP